MLHNNPLPVEIVFHPSWWHRYADISFDQDFFYHPLRRVEVERKMEQVLYDRFGDLGLGEDKDKDLPIIGAVHNAAGFLLSEMLGCEVRYYEDAPPQVVTAEQLDLCIDIDATFRSTAFKRLEKLIETLKAKYGYVAGDVNWGGILNLAFDLRGQSIFLDMFDRPNEVCVFFQKIAAVIERFTSFIEKETGTTSISVNRTVRHFKESVFLHSECTLTMISVEHYEKFILPIDREWSRHRSPFGIHYCGADLHRFAEILSDLPHLDFLDVGWEGDINIIRRHLPETFLNIRLSPIELNKQSEDEIRQSIVERVLASGNPSLTGVCCINMDDNVTDDKIRAIFGTVFEMRKRYMLSK